MLQMFWTKPLNIGKIAHDEYFKLFGRALKNGSKINSSDT